MVSTVARKNQKMESTADHRERITLAIQVDRLFKDYEIYLSPTETLAFAANAPSAGSFSPASFSLLISQLNSSIPPANFGTGHPQTGRAHHSYRICRERGLRLLKLEIFKGFFPLDYDFMNLLEAVHALGTAAGAQIAIDAGNNSYSIEMRWPGGDR